MQPDTLQAATAAASGFPKEMYVFAGAVLGAVIAAIVAVVVAGKQGDNQLALAKVNNTHTEDLEKTKLQDQRERDRTTFLRDRAEVAHQILSRIATENSITSSYITQVTGVTLADYHHEYLRRSRALHKLQMIADLYFPSIGETATKLAGKVNTFWGHQQAMLHYAATGQPNLEAAERAKVVATGLEVDTLVTQGKNDLRLATRNLKLTSEA